MCADTARRRKSPPRCPHTQNVRQKAVRRRRTPQSQQRRSRSRIPAGLTPFAAPECRGGPLEAPPQRWTSRATSENPSKSTIFVGTHEDAGWVGNDGLQTQLRRVHECRRAVGCRIMGTVAFRALGRDSETSRWSVEQERRPRALSLDKEATHLL